MYNKVEIKAARPFKNAGRLSRLPNKESSDNGLQVPSELGERFLSSSPENLFSRKEKHEHGHYEKRNGYWLQFQGEVRLSNEIKENEGGIPGGLLFFWGK